MTAVERYRNELVEALWADGRYHIDPRRVVELADKAVAELEADLAAMTKREKVAAMFGDAFEDAAKGCHWMLEYERGLSHVIVACWQYASRADEA